MDRYEQIRQAAEQWQKQWQDIHRYNKRDMLIFRMGASWADAHPQWISVEDGLPEYYKPVIVGYRVRAVDGTIDLDYCAAFLNGNDEWVAFGYNVQNAMINAKVTHWIPMPELSEEGGEE